MRKNTKLSASRMGLLAGLLGTLALCLPFYYRTIPYQYFMHKIHRGEGLEAILAWAGLLAVPIFIWHALRLIGRRAGRIEIGLIYILSAAAMIPPLAWSTYLAFEFLTHSHDELINFLFIHVPSLLVITNFVLLRRNLKSKRVAETTCSVFLLGAYVPNALLAITYVIFIADCFGRDDIGAGAYLILAAGILCLGSIFTAMTTRSRSPEHTETELASPDA